MAAAVAVFALLYAGMQGYVLHHAVASSGIGPAGAAGGMAWIALMTVMPPILWRVERRGPNPGVVAAAWLAYAWMGLAFVLFWVLLALEGLRVAVGGACALAECDVAAILPSPGAQFAGAVALALSVSAYGFADARRLRTRRIVLPARGLATGEAALTVVQVSDVHLGALVGQRHLRRILAAVADARPDVLVSTGDLLDGLANHREGLAPLLASVQPRLGKYAVLGNHECFVGIERAIEFHRRAGFTVLRGEGVTVAGLLNIAGMDDPTAGRFGQARGRPEEDVLGTLPRGLFTVLLKHQPILAPGSRGLFDLQLSGHVHGGQIFPFGLLPRLTYRVRDGLTALGTGWLYVSRGAGTWGPPLRVLAPPEIAVFELRPPGTSGGEPRAGLHGAAL
jgi:hypothetical protein